MTGDGWLVRPVRAADLPEIARLCVAHARYERLEPPDDGFTERLAAEWFAPSPRAWCHLAEAADGVVAGYASGSAECDPGIGRYQHLDCLFVAEPYRGRGAGADLLAAVVADARCRGLRRLRWQTPPWNSGAIRFYLREGAAPTGTVQFSRELLRTCGPAA